MPFFYREKNIFGKWSPVITPERPDTKTATGRKVAIKDVTEITDEYNGLSLAELDRRIASS